jgi:hypothetical protein
VLLVGAGGTLLRLGVDGSSVIYRHPSRATFSGALEAPDGTIWLAGMDGLGRLVEAVAQ